MGDRVTTAGQMIRLMLESDAYLAQVFYRLGAWAKHRRIPGIWRLASWAASTVAQVHVGPDVVVGPGWYLAHGQVSLQGPVTLGAGVVMFPWSSVVASAGSPVTIGVDVRVGTGAVIQGPCRVGDHARIGANAVVTGDVANGAKVAGIPARAIGAVATR